jgi:transcriptional regulator with XRE-family HTH domain
MAETSEIDMDLVSDLIQRRRSRERLSLRDAAREIGVSAPTLQRAEAKQVPKANALIRIADWLNVTIDDLRKKPRKSKERGTIERIEVSLRADPQLDHKSAAAIADIVRQVYDGFTKGKKTTK